jgi:hypothetical protein
LHFPEPSLLRLWKQSRCLNNCAVKRKRQLGTRYLSRAAYIFDPYAKYRRALIWGTQIAFKLGYQQALTPQLAGSLQQRPMFWLRSSSALTMNSDLSLEKQVLKDVASDFISADGFGITEAARRYLAPLIVGEAYPPFKAT